MILTDLKELKSLLQLDPLDTSSDKSLNFLVSFASDWIGEILGRPDLSKRAVTQFYEGSGTQRLVLRNRPVFTTPTIQVWVDSQGLFGAVSGSFASDTALVWGDDFGLQIDQDDGTSRSGLLVRNNDIWPKGRARKAGLLSPYISPSYGSIKATYTAGYTADTLPEAFRMATNLLAMKMNYILPIGIELGSESYEERSLGFIVEKKEYLTSLVRPLIIGHRNWFFGR